jgi:hypothetical protein
VSRHLKFPHVRQGAVPRTARIDVDRHTSQRELVRASLLLVPRAAH